MKITGLLLLLISTVTAVGYFVWYKPRFDPANKGHLFAAPVALKNKENKAFVLRLQKQASALRSYVVNKDFNSRFCFLIDMDISSGKKRFFVYNLETDSVEMAGLVTHGSGLAGDGDGIKFSNVSGSNCTSPGKYRIGKSYTGKFGLAYKLFGLDKTNSKAFERFVVLHAHDCVPVSEVYPLPICESWGCPTVSPTFLQSLKQYIDASEKPILLKIYK